MGIVQSAALALLDSCRLPEPPTTRAEHGSYSIQGRKARDPLWPNQDACAYFELPGGQAGEDGTGAVPPLQGFVLCDGHGPRGHLVAARCTEALPGHLEETRMGYHEAFRTMQRGLEGGEGGDGDVEARGLAWRSGTTCVVAALEGRRLTVASVGDSLAVLALRQGGGRYGASVVSAKAHRPSRPDERRRIEAGGGRVGVTCDGPIGNGAQAGPLRVWSSTDEGGGGVGPAGVRMVGLAMTRSLGDVAHHRAGVTHEPELESHILEEGDDFAIVASDGVWDVLSPKEAVGIVQRCALSMSRDNHYGWEADAAARHLCEAARERWEVLAPNHIDDITCTIIKLENR